MYCREQHLPFKAIRIMAYARTVYIQQREQEISDQSFKTVNFFH